MSPAATASRLSLVPDTCSECARLRAAHDAMHRKLMGMRGEVKSIRERARQGETALSQVTGMLASFHRAYSVITSAQAAKRMDAGLESANDILQLAAGIMGPEDFDSWLSNVESTVSGATKQRNAG